MTETRGDAFRARVARSYDLTNPAESELVEEAARLLDLVDELQAVVKATGVLGIGSQGQPVQSPALVALQAARAELRQVLRVLALPSIEEDS